MIINWKTLPININGRTQGPPLRTMEIKRSPTKTFGDDTVEIAAGGSELMLPSARQVLKSSMKGNHLSGR